MFFMAEKKIWLPVQYFFPPYIVSTYSKDLKMVHVPSILGNAKYSRAGVGRKDEHKMCDLPRFPTSFCVLYLVKYKVWIGHPWPQPELFQVFFSQLL